MKYPSRPATACAGQMILVIAMLLGAFTFGVVMATKYFDQQDHAYVAQPTDNLQLPAAVVATTPTWPASQTAGRHDQARPTHDTGPAANSGVTPAAKPVARAVSADSNPFAPSAADDGVRPPPRGGGHIVISGSGDRISVTREQGARLIQGTDGSEATTDNATEAAGNEPTNYATPDTDVWPTPNCPNELPAGSTLADANVMKENYGCGYLEYCRITTDGSGDVICWYGLRFIPPASS